jgi:hypothetical protein
MVLNHCVFDIFYQNVRGLRTKSSYLMDNVLANNFKVYCITKTCSNDTILSHNLFPDSYCVFRAGRDYLNSNTKHGGGVLVADSK